MDNSALDKKYFVDCRVFNCPFCKRNNLPYKMTDSGKFNWNLLKKCYYYVVRCSHCSNESLHWAWKEIRKNSCTPPQDGYYTNEFKDIKDLDGEFFFHQPTSEFVLDNRINSLIRDLLTEADNCRSANSLVGASACLRKAIYEFLNIENCLVIKDGEKYVSYNESIDKAKEKFPNVSPKLFGALRKIKELTSNLVHEDSWTAWTSGEISQIIKLFKYILYEVYVRDDEQNKMLADVDIIEKKLSGVTINKVEAPVKQTKNKLHGN